VEGSVRFGRSEDAFRDHYLSACWYPTPVVGKVQCILSRTTSLGEGKKREGTVAEKETGWLLDPIFSKNNQIRERGKSLYDVP